MVTFLRPFPHAHGPTTVNVRLRRSHHHQPSSLLPCRRSNLRSMAQDPSHPHRQSKEHDAAPTSQQELTQELPPAPSPRRDVQEPSTSSSSGSSDTSSWLKLGIGQSLGSPSPPLSSSRRKRHRNDYEAGPSTSVQSAAPPLELGLSLFPAGSSSPSSTSAVATAAAGAVVAAAPPPGHEAGTWFVLQAAQNQTREPPLPPIPRSYLRVSRDGRLTVRVVMRYLVNKLGLEDDSQLAAGPEPDDRVDLIRAHQASLQQANTNSSYLPF